VDRRKATYAPQGAISSAAYNSGKLAETWSYNSLQQPISFGVAYNGGAPLLSLTWGYGASMNSTAAAPADDNSNVTGQTIARSSGLAATLTQTFGYSDPANRLKTASEGSAWSQTYSYDAFGNRAVTAGAWWQNTQNLTIPNAAYTPQSVSQFTAQNQWVRGTARASCTTPDAPGLSADKYDCAGNQISVAQYGSYETAASTFTYDGENRLLTTNIAQSGGPSFVYDGEGRRVQKISSSGTTTYIHDAKGELAMEVSTAAPTASGTQYLTADTLGSTRLITDASGNPQRCIDYLPFGEEIPAGVDGRTGCYENLASPQYPSAPDVADQKFTGKERDSETGLDYFGARYFSGAQGRFTSPDRVIVTPARLGDPQRFDLYSYARNNPFRFIDPNGEDIAFANDTEEGRKKALAAITKNLSAQEAANIGIRQKKDGSYEGYVIDTRAIGKGASAEYTKLTGLIGDHSIVAEVGLIGGGLSATFSRGMLAGAPPVSQFSSLGSEGGFTFQPVGKDVNILVTQGSVPGGVQVWCCNGKGVYQGVEPDWMTMWHELVGETLKYRAGHEYLQHNPDLDSRTVIKIENEDRADHDMNPRTGADHGQTVITVSGKVQ